MEIQFFQVLLALIFSLLLVKYICKHPTNKHEKLPPSPPMLPLIGHLHHLVGEVTHRALARLAREYGPVLHLKLGQVSAIVISSPEAAKAVLKEQDPACADRPKSIGSTIMWYDHVDLAFSPYNELWRQLRKICTSELLSARNVKSFGHIRRDEVSRLIKSIELFSSSTSGGTTSSMNITGKIFALTSTIICRVALGEVATRDRDMLLALLKKALTLAGVRQVADLFPSFELLGYLSWNKYMLLRMRRRLDFILDAMLEEHKSKERRGELGGEDIVDVLLRMQRTQEEHNQLPITNETIKGVIFDLFAAGTETSASTVDWAMAELMRNPHVMTKVQVEVRQAFKGKKNEVDESDVQNFKYLKLVIKETLRLHPPIAMVPRVCRDECIVDGYSVPLKSTVLVNIWSIGRDPQYWDDPESFKPERFENGSIDFMGNDYQYLPFGAGKRGCPGMSFALASVELTLSRLLYHFDWEMPRGTTRDDIDMSEVEAIAMSRKNDLFLVPTLYNDED